MNHHNLSARLSLTLGCWLGGHLSASAQLSEGPPQPTVGLTKLGDLAPGPRNENSGIVKSRTRNDLFWTQNDSGDEPRVYPIRRDGSLYASAREPDTPGVSIGGAIDVDWEDIAVMNDGTLVVADVGNNDNDRRDLVLYFVDEPSPLASRTTYRRRVFVRYPDQRQFPAPEGDFNYDCEAIYAIGDAVYLLTKHRSDTRTTAYRLTDFSEGTTHTLERLHDFEIGGQVTGADALPDGSRIVVTTYERMWLFEVADPARPFDKCIGTHDFVADNLEAVCFDGPDRIVCAAEGSGQIYEVQISDFKPLVRQP